MDTKEKTTLHTHATINAPIETVWESWTKPEHITQWNQPSDDWHCPKAANDLRKGGKFSSTMAAKDGSMSFEFAGAYTEVVPHELIAYELEDSRKVTIEFSQANDGIKVDVAFEAEEQNSHEMQQAGWQAIHDNFKAYTESL